MKRQRNDIKALMVRKGLKQSTIADQLGVKRSSISGPVNGLWRSERVQRHIAAILGRDYEKLWGRQA